MSFSASRGAPGQASTTSARLCVHVCQYEEVGCGTSDYEVIRCKSILIEFLFTGLHRLSVEDFNHQNVINSIEFRQVEDQVVEVELESIFGMGALIHCSQVEVVEVTSLL
ncbi:Imm50 family immunity protein [Pseudomonas sp. SDO5271_S396]